MKYEIIRNALPLLTEEQRAEISSYAAEIFNQLQNESEYYEKEQILRDSEFIRSMSSDWIKSEEDLIKCGYMLKKHITESTEFVSEFRGNISGFLTGNRIIFSCNGTRVGYSDEQLEYR